MPDTNPVEQAGTFLQTLFNSPETGPLPPLPDILFRVVLALACGFVVAALYWFTLGRTRKDARSMSTTLVLLAVLIAVMMLGIGNNTARAFGVVGALSIVRFRTVVEDTADTAFVIFAVTLGMAVGAGYWLLAVVAIPSVGGAAVLMTWLERPRNGQSVTGTLVVKLGLGHDPGVLLQPTLTEHLSQSALTGTATTRQGAALDVTYAVTLRQPTGSFALVTALNKLEGVQGVEYRQG